MATMNVSLPDAMKDWVDQQVASGRYASSSDVVRDLVRREQARADARLQLDKMVEEALASGFVEMSRDELLARMKAKRLAALERHKSD